jgi:hypothetical protein
VLWRIDRERRGGGRGAGFAVTPGQRDLLCQLLLQRLPGVRVLAYGTRAAGWSATRSLKPHSDLDLALLGPITDLAMAEVRADLDESDLPWRVDLTRFDELPVALQQAILARGCELFQAAVVSP